MFSDLFRSIDALITEHGSAAILNERIIQLREHVERIQLERNQLLEENQRLHQTIQDLRTELEQERIPDDFCEHRGVLFRRQPDGHV